LLHLSSITKGNSNVCYYLCSIRFIVDELALVGYFVDDLDLVIVALNGLGLLILIFVQESALMILRYYLMNFLTNLLTIKFSSIGGATTIVLPYYCQPCFLLSFSHGR